MKQKMDQQVLNNFAKININSSAPNIPINLLHQNYARQGTGLAHHRPMQRPGTPQYQQKVNLIPQQIPVDKDQLFKSIL